MPAPTLSEHDHVVWNGLRPRLLALLATLLLVAFGLIYVATSAYTELAFERTERGQVELLVAVMRDQTPTDVARLPAAWKQRPLTAAVLEDANSKVLDAFGPAELLPTLPAPPAATTIRRATLGTNSGLAVAFPHGNYRVRAFVASVPGGSQTLPQLIALYLGLVGGALLLAVYFAATRWILTPIDRLVQAAEQVPTGRTWRLPEFRSNEFARLAKSLATMTERLLQEERSLHDKIHELERARAHLNSAQNQLVRSERLASVGQLAAGLAHEIGNPLAAIQGLLDLLLTGDLEPEQHQDFLRRVSRETERINRILRDLLQFARAPKATAQASTGATGDVASAVKEALSLLEPQPSFRAIHLEQVTEPALPRVNLDQERLTQVLLNLLLNAAAACNGNGTIRVTAARKEGFGVTLAVEDSGPGVDPELGETIFEPFVTSKEVGEGSGLGLAVCRGLVEAAGGSIGYDATFSPGARFWLDLPAAPAGTRGATDAAHAPPQ